MVKVASRPPALAATLLFLLAGALAHADIGFDAAAATARMLNPGRPLIGLRHKINANPAITSTWPTIPPQGAKGAYPALANGPCPTIHI